MTPEEWDQLSDDEKRAMLPKAPPKSPWDFAEIHRRYELGCHRELHCKCRECGLEMLLFTLREREEIASGWGVDVSSDMARARLLYCPECGTRGELWAIEAYECDGTINSAMSRPRTR